MYPAHKPQLARLSHAGRQLNGKNGDRQGAGFKGKQASLPELHARQYQDTQEK